MARSPGRSTLAGSIGWFAVSYAAALVGYVAINALASRMLGPSEFGYFVVALSVTTLVGQLGLMGAHRSALRDAARIAEGDVPQVRRLRAAVRAVSLVTLPVFALLSGLVTWFVLAGQSTSTRLLVAVGIGVLVVMGGQQKLWANYLRGFGHVRLASLLEGRSGGAAVALGQAALLAVLLLAVPAAGLPAALAAAAVGYLLPVLVAWRLVARRWSDVPTPYRPLRDTRDVLVRDWRFASAQVAAYLNTNVELWMAALLLSATATSQFSAADRLVLLLVVPMTSLQVVFSPVVARLGTSDVARTQRLLRTAATGATAVTAIAWLPMLIVPGPLIDLVYGPGYGGASTAVVLLTLGYLVNALTGLSGTTLSMTDHEGAVATTTWLGVALRVVVGVPMALTLGVLGLAAAKAFCSAVVFAALWSRSRSLTGISTHATLRPDLGLLRRTAG